MKPRTLRPALMMLALSGSALLALSGFASLAGCSTFERDWDALAEEALAEDAPAEAATAEETMTEEAMRQPASEDAGIEGRWDGTWLSSVNGHNGRLRCIVATDEDGSLQARYRAAYAGCFSFEYTVPMTVRQDGEIYRFSAEADLGWLAGGRYEYEGTVAGDEFTSTYTSARDHGVFEMRRVE